MYKITSQSVKRNFFNGKRALSNNDEFSKPFDLEELNTAIQEIQRLVYTTKVDIKRYKAKKNVSKIKTNQFFFLFLLKNTIKNG